DRAVHARLDENWLDLDFVSRDFTLAESGWWRWTVGGRLASLYADFHVQDGFPLQALPILMPGSQPFSFPITVRQRAPDESWGGGGHLGLEGSWRIGETALALVGRADGGILASANRQRLGIAVDAVLPGPDGSGAHFSSPELGGSVEGPGVIPTLNVQAG